MTTKNQKFTEKHSATIKVVIVSILTLLLLIPTSMIRNLISERKERQHEAIEDISSKWGKEQVLTGPILTVPYQTFETDKDGNKINKKTHNAFFLPEALTVSGNITPNIRSRDIFKVVVYKSKLHFEGKFIAPDFLKIINKNYEILNNEAFFIFGISDMRGVNESIKFKMNNNTLNCEGGTKIKEILNSGFTTANFNILTDTSGIYNFSFDISLNGSNNISFIPVGKETKVKLNSSWKSPSFDGAFLPDNRDINDNGFVADWKILQFNRNFPQNWTDNEIDFSSSAFGVSLLLPVDMYQKTDRSIKYAILFISLSFAVFFFVEILKKSKVHPIQYILIGLGLCLFYLLLLSLSEQINFGLAYLIASSGIIGLTVLYSKSIFKKNILSFLLAGILAFLYGFIYILLQMEDYALLMGSLGLFIVLAVLMYLSRKVNWYEINSTEKELEIEKETEQ